MKKEFQHTRSGPLLFAALLLWILAPTAAFAMLSFQALNADIEPTKNVYLGVRPGGDQISRPVEIELRWGEPSVLVAPGWTGLVQAVGPVKGGMLQSGDLIATVDGVRRVAVQSTIPFADQLRAGDRGTEVIQLQKFLKAQGLLSKVSGTFDHECLTAVRKFAQAIGVSTPEKVEAFLPEWVVFLPREAQVQKVDLVVGAPAPTPGSVIATIAPDLLFGAVAEQGGVADPNPDQDSTNPSNDQVPTSRLNLDTDETLWFDGKLLALEKDRSSLSRRSLQELAAIVPGGASKAAATVTTSVSGSAWIVPSSAVTLDSRGSSCVVVHGSKSDQIVKIEIRKAINGELVVSGALHPEDKVRIFPSGVEFSCLEQ